MILSGNIGMTTKYKKLAIVKVKEVPNLYTIIFKENGHICTSWVTGSYVAMRKRVIDWENITPIDKIKQFEDLP